MRYFTVLYRWIKKEPIKGCICLCILAAHLAVLHSILFPPFHKKVGIVKKRLNVHTVQAIPPKKMAPLAATKTAQKKPSTPAATPKAEPKPAAPEKKSVKKPEPKVAHAPKKTPEPPPKKTPSAQKKPPIADKKVTAEKKIAAKKSAALENKAEIPADLLQELEKSITKMESAAQVKRSVKKMESAPPSQPVHSFSEHSSSLAHAQDVKAEEDGFKQLLASCLHDALHLPEYGEVKMELTLRRDGSVAKLVVIKTESEKNRKYLEEELPRLKLPYLDERFFPNKQHTFILTFCNEI